MEEDSLATVLLFFEVMKGKNTISSRTVCRQCHCPIDWRITKAGKRYRAETDSRKPHRCSTSGDNLRTRDTADDNPPLRKSDEPAPL